MSDEKKITETQLASVMKGLEWMQISKPSVAARDIGLDVGAAQPDGTALPPHEQDCGRAHPISGANSDDLTEWCIKHQT